MSTMEIVDLVFKVLLGLTALVFTILTYSKKMGWAKGERFKKVQGFFELGFAAVEGYVKASKTPVDNKLLEFLKRVNELLKEHGEKELTPEELLAAKTFAENKALADKKDK